MRTQRSVALLASCGTMVLAGWFFAGPVSFTSRGVEKTDERATAPVGAALVVTPRIHVATADLTVPLLNNIATRAAAAVAAPSAADASAFAPSADVAAVAPAIEPAPAADVTPALPQESEATGAAAPASVSKVASADSKATGSKVTAVRTVGRSSSEEGASQPDAFRP